MIIIISPYNSRLRSSSFVGSATLRFNFVAPGYNYQASSLATAMR